MPTYSYRCDACDSEWEQEQRISEAAVRKCPKCGKLKARRMITNGNFILKGGGWYSDGYGAGSKSSRSKDKDDSGSSTKVSTSTKDEAKPAKSSSETKDSKESKDSKDSKGSSGSGGSAKSAAAS